MSYFHTFSRNTLIYRLSREVLYMCTAVRFEKNGLYFGRNLDYEIKFGDNVVITPRNYCFEFRFAGVMREHYAMIGMAHVAENYPLYYDGINEKGLAMAGLNFVDNAFYGEPEEGKFALAPHEFIPFVLGQCSSLAETRELLKKVRIVNEPFNSNYPISELHWMISDKSGSIVAESTKQGFFVYDDPFDILTNNPEFPNQTTQINNYMGVSRKPAENRFCSGIPLKAYSRGMGAIGLPGDLSSESRFARAAFIKANSVCGDSEEECVSQVFHILASVENPSGCCELENGEFQITQYTCCCNCDKGIYYYNCYNNHQINAVDMHRENLNTCKLIIFEPQDKERINFQN